MFSSSKKKADLPPEKKHCATIVDLAATDAEQGSEWKFEKSKFDVGGYFDTPYFQNKDSIEIGSDHETNRALVVYSTIINNNIFNMGRILKNLTDKVDAILAQNKELQDRCDSLENEVKVLKR